MKNFLATPSHYKAQTMESCKKVVKVFKSVVAVFCCNFITATNFHLKVSVKTIKQDLKDKMNN